MQLITAPRNGSKVYRKKEFKRKTKWNEPKKHTNTVMWSIVNNLLFYFQRIHVYMMMYFYSVQLQQHQNKLFIQIWNTNIFSLSLSLSRSRSSFNYKLMMNWTTFSFPIAVINSWDCGRRQKAIERKTQQSNSCSLFLFTKLHNFIWYFKLLINNMWMIRFHINMLRFLLSFIFSFVWDLMTVKLYYYYLICILHFFYLSCYH